jgi:disease resistance protein
MMIRKIKMFHASIIRVGQFSGTLTRHGTHYLFGKRLFSRTCCGKGNMDWDDFMKIPGCSVGSHSDIKPEKPVRLHSHGSDSFLQTAPQLISPDICPQKHSEETIETERPQKPWVSERGLRRCVHAACQKEYDQSQNTDDSCEYHSGTATFKDTRKFWSCCNAGSYDWDDFMKIPKCAKGKHEPKMVDA